MRPAVRVLVTACVVLTSACGSGGAPAKTLTPTASATADSKVVGLLAVGHSGLTGYASDPARPKADAGENSWVTGTNPAVDSIYARMVAAEPDAKNHVYNAGIDGSQATALVQEIIDGLKVVPHPQLVIIQTIDNDLTCDGNDAANLKPFGAAVKAALDLISQSSPQSQVLTMTQFGRPANYTAAYAKDPVGRQLLAGDGPCDTVDGTGHVVPAHVQHLTGLLESYEAELARVCATSAQCHFSKAASTYLTALADSEEGNHQNVRGHRRWAALMWPAVARILGLPAG